MNYYKILDMIIQPLVLALLIYAIFFVIPDFRKAYESCNRQILCEYGSLPATQCLGFEYGKYYNRNPLLKIWSPKIDTQLGFDFNATNITSGNALE